MARILVMFLAVAGTACGDDGQRVSIDAMPIDDAMPTVDAWFGPCSPTLQVGCDESEKCTSVIDSSGQFPMSSTECVPAGTAQLGEACTHGSTGSLYFDNCAAGLYCGYYDLRCRTICSVGGSGCPGTQRCDDYAGLFQVGSDAPVAGLCEQPCDPLADNDFDGTATTLSKSGNACGADPNVGCYGYASNGSPPATRFVCAAERNYPTRLVHRTTAPELTFTSCSQGYLPLLIESTGSTTVICVAMCKPLNCYSGNCGANDENRLGEAPHRCNTTDRRGAFDNGANGEHCRFLWSFEIDLGTMTHLPSSFSDSVGFCFDHSKYQYDSTDDGNPDPLAPCAQLPDGWGTGTLGAADVGCVDSTRLPMMATGKPRRVTPLDKIRVPFALVR